MFVRSHFFLMRGFEIAELKDIIVFASHICIGSGHEHDFGKSVNVRPFSCSIKDALTKHMIIKETTCYFSKIAKTKIPHCLQYTLIRTLVTSYLVLMQDQ